jgi:protein-S-isoprenylcysteine O-methyltransferase Ste14
MAARIKSSLLVAVQLAVFCYFVFSGPLIAKRLLWLAVEIGGALFGLSAIWCIGLREVRVLPDVAANARLVTNGPYRFVRHPMYSAVLVMAAALVADNFSTPRLIAWLVLLADLVAKLKYEERLLAQRFPDYRDYQRRTKRLVPFLY